MSEYRDRSYSDNHRDIEESEASQTLTVATFGLILNIECSIRKHVEAFVWSSVVNTQKES